MVEDKKVSVIIPVYNVEAYLPRCMDTIMSQTYQNLEIILVDDGATDSSGQLCDDFAKADARIQVLHKVNGGLSDARNYGLKKATGDYVIFIDSDDFVHKRMIEILIYLANEKESDFVECKFEYAYEGKEIVDASYDETVILESAACLSDYDFQKMYFDDEKMRLHNTVAWNKLIARNLLNGIEFPKGKMHEDEATTFKIAHKAENICISTIPLYYYFVRSGSIMQEFKASRFDIFDAYVERIQCYVDWNYQDLAGKMLFHAMHMLCQYKKWAEDDNKDFRLLINEKRKMISSKSSSVNITITFGKKIEKMIFNVAFSFYYLMWQAKHH